MQTFLPFPSFRRSAEVLDRQRLGKQRVETLQILRALVIPEYGWANHPAVRMWAGHLPALVVYGRACVEVWRELGFGDVTWPQIREFAPADADADQADLAAAGRLPVWVGDDDLHASHRSALVRKDPAHYEPLLGAVDPQLPYVWPPAGTEPLDAPPAGERLWIVRPRTPAALGAMLGEGIVALDDASGIASDAGGLDLPLLAARLRTEAPGRRPGKDLRQLAVLVGDVEMGDPVGVPVEGGAGLLVGTVTGGYQHLGLRRSDGLRHARTVRWDRRVARSAVRPPALLQDPRSLFRVPVTEETARLLSGSD